MINIPSGCNWGSVTNHEVAWNTILSMSRGKGRISTQASIAPVGADLNAPVMWRLACLCIFASLAMNPFIPLLLPVSGMRKRSVA